MLCKNCERDKGIEAYCPYCGYNPDVDDKPYVQKPLDKTAFIPRPLEVTYIKRKNVPATFCMIFSFFGIIPIFTLLSMIFGLVGLGRVKKAHSGMPQIIIGFAIDFGIIAIAVAVIVLAIVPAVTRR